MIGLDLGSKTIGVAACHLAHGLATPCETLMRAATERELERDIERVVAIVRARGAGRVIVGHPLELDGRRGRRALLTETFAARLGAALGPEVPVDLWDERMSTAGAERSLVALDTSRARRREVIDAHAAQWILQGWIDAQVSQAVCPADEGRS